MIANQIWVSVIDVTSVFKWRLLIVISGRPWDYHTTENFLAEVFLLTAVTSRMLKLESSWALKSPNWVQWSIFDLILLVYHFLLVIMVVSLFFILLLWVVLLSATFEPLNVVPYLVFNYLAEGYLWLLNMMIRKRLHPTGYNVGSFLLFLHLGQRHILLKRDWQLIQINLWWLRRHNVLSFLLDSLSSHFLELLHLNILHELNVMAWG